MNGGGVDPFAAPKSPSWASIAVGRAAFPGDLDLRPISRWPTQLAEATVSAVMAAPWPKPESIPDAIDEPKTTIIVVTLDNFVFNRLCLESLLASTVGASCEILVVDNGSTDGTVKYLHHLSNWFSHVQVLINDRNMGFAASNNRALSQARGNNLVLLNNDTVLPSGWLPRLTGYLDDPQIGLVGPVTNRAGNEAQIETSYRTIAEFNSTAEDRAHAYRSHSFDIRVATMFCTAIRREAFAQVGLLDERFEIGLFEDDDYSMRMRAAGYCVVCAEDVLVHHFGQASIGKLAAAGRYGELFHANRRRWEEKWNASWEPYSLRQSNDYLELAERVRAAVTQVVPPGSTVAVVSKGDESLLHLGDCIAWHFPRNDDGNYSGFYPADSRDAIEQLERARRAGASYLIIPHTSLWWLEHYAEFASHLVRNYIAVLNQPGTCLIYSLATHEQLAVKGAGVSAGVSDRGTGNDQRT